MTNVQINIHATYLRFARTLLQARRERRVFDRMAANVQILDGASPSAIELGAVHPGGRAVLDAVERGLALEPRSLAASRAVLEQFGDMSSATVMFVLQSLLATAKPGARGCAMSFGPGLTAETMLFHEVEEVS